MLGNEMNDFDLQIRSMLEDAEVKPSRRVWKVVSSRIAAGSKPAAAYWGWMRWAAACAAFAALAVGVFLGLNHTEIERYAAVLPVETAAPVEPAAWPSVAPAPVSAPGLSIANPPASAVPADVESLVPVLERTTEQVPEVIKEAALEVMEEPSPAETGTEVEAEEYLPIEWEDEKKSTVSRPLQLYAEGALLANESDISGSRPRAYMSSGTEIIKCYLDAMLAKNIKNFNHQSPGILSEETHRCGSIPYKFIGVVCRIVISAAAAHGNVCGDVKVMPVKVTVSVNAVIEGVNIHIAVRLLVVA